MITDDDVISGMRKNCNVFIYVDLKKALEDGFSFFRSQNGVILSPGNDRGILPIRYFEKVVLVKQGAKSMGKMRSMKQDFCRQRIRSAGGRTAQSDEGLYLRARLLNQTLPKL